MQKANKHYPINFVGLFSVLILSILLIFWSASSKEEYTKFSYSLKSYSLILSDMILVQIPQAIENLHVNSQTINELRSENNDLQLELMNQQKDLMVLKQKVFQYDELVKSINLVNNSNIKSFMTVELIDTRILNNYSVSQQYLIQAGENHGIDVGNLVVSTLGVAGYISEIFPNYSEVTSISNNLFKIAGISSVSKIDVIINGRVTNRDGKIIGRVDLFNQEMHNLIVGEDVYTSGLEGTFPNYMPIGKLQYNKEHEVWEVEFNENFNNLKYVHIVK